MINERAIEEAAYQWTGRRIAYGQLDERFVARIKQILEPVIPHIVAEYRKGLTRGEA